MHFTVREAQAQDTPFLWEMLYESLFVPEGQQPFDKKILHEPSIAKYAECWGREGDAGFIAVNGEGQPAGSVTARYFTASNKGYGFVREDIPELSMAVSRDCRGKGIGTALLGRMLQRLRENGVKQVSLSVDPRNAGAVRLYKNFGFKEAGQVDTSITMVAEITED
ncbi:GNAT family N-acetyltransferase [Paenibacillus humicola]|uniref:GNAT family N-acetyltransferase n=1 Tax=Paenibacillus humicola TaxID=3110540 RepID=UPI00237AA8BA|nr:GNAT family N-acetyltransferase [Paenibacillus humicola]